MGAGGSVHGGDGIGPEDGSDVAGDGPEAHAAALAEVERLRALIRENKGGASEEQVNFLVDNDYDSGGYGHRNEVVRLRSAIRLHLSDVGDGDDGGSDDGGGGDGGGAASPAHPDCADPWADFDGSVDDQFKLLDADDLEDVCFVEVDEDPDAAFAAFLDGGGGGGGGGGACKLSVADHELEAFALSDAMKARVVWLDLSTNLFPGDDGAGALSVGPSWLRGLNLSGNPNLTACPPLAGVGATLLLLDLSFCDGIADFNAASVDLASCTALRALVLESCGLTAVPANVADVAATLQKLMLGENDIEDVAPGLAALASLSGANALRELDLRENACCDAGRAYRAFVRGALPGLKVLDNKILSMAGGAVRLDQIDGLQEAVTRTDTVADAAEGLESCSCLEGTACASKYSCKDWEHRHEIAKKVRMDNMHQSRIVDKQLGL